MGKRHSETSKLQVVLKLLKEESTLSAISKEYRVSSSTIKRWKNELLGNNPQIISNIKSLLQMLENEYHSNGEKLFAEIGRMKMEGTIQKKEYNNYL